MGEQILLDLGAADVHVPGAIGAKKSAASELYVSAKQRSKMPARQFADPANKAYPIHDKAHADNAAARLEQQKGSMSKGKYQAIKRRIKAAQRRFGEKPKTAASVPSKSSGYRIRLMHPGGGSTVIQHRMSADGSSAPPLTAMWLPDKGGQLCTYIPIDKTAALADPTPDEAGNKRVWVQVARTGAWAGHPQGAFAITQQTLDQIVNNFYAQRFGRVQWDFDHSSAMPANSGTLPQVGKPAQGWIYDFKRDGDKLYALTEWLPLARQYIENDQYGGVSPVINWHFPDRATGRDAGPTITSVALTNLPFITDMDRPIAASVNGIPQHTRGPMALTEVTPEEAHRLSAGSDGDAFCYYSTEDLLPRLKQTFGLHELSTVQQCRSALSNLGTHLDAVDGDGSAHHEGVNLGTYISSLRDMVGRSSGMSSTELIQFIDGILDAYMKENGIEDDDSDLDNLSLSATPDTTAAAAAVETPPVATAASTEGASVADPQTPPVVTTEPATVTNAATGPTPSIAEATTTAASAAAPVVEQAPNVEVSELTLQLAAERAENERLKAQVQALSSATDNEEQRLSAEIDSVIRVYGKSKGLSVELKPHLLSLLKAKPDSFRAAYPPVTPEQEHLLLNLTGGGASNPHAPGARTQADTAAPIASDESAEIKQAKGIIALGIDGITDQLVSAGMPFTTAQLKADEALSTARLTLNSTRQG